MKRLLWRLRSAVILHREYGWNRRLAWQYTRGLWGDVSIYGQDMPTPRQAVEDDRRFWE